MNKIWKWGIFRYTLLSYLGILMIPVLLGVCAYARTVWIVEKQIRLNVQATLNNFRETFSGSLQDMDAEFALLTGDAKIRGVENLNPVSSDQSSVRDPLAALNYMKRYRKRYPLDGMFYLMFQKNEAVLSSGSLLFGYQFFYDSHLKELLSLPYDSLMQELAKVKGKQFLAQTPDANYLIYCNPIYSYHQQEIEGYGLYLINRTELLQLISNALQDHYFLLCDGEHQTITGMVPGDAPLPERFDPQDYKARNGRIQYAGEDMIFVETLWSDYQLHMYAMLPVRAVMKDVFSLKTLFAGLVIAAGLLGVGLALYLSYKSSNPLVEMAAVFQMEPVAAKAHPKSFLNRMKTGLFHLEQQNQELAQEQSRQKGILKELYIEKLLTGKMDEREIGSWRDLGILLPEDSLFTAVAASFYRYYDNAYAPDREQGLDTELSRLRIVLDTQLNEASDSQMCAYIAMTGGNRMGILFCLEGSAMTSAAGKIKSIVAHINGEMERLLHTSCFWGIGRVCHTIPLIPKSFQEACQALEYLQTLPDYQSMYSYIDIPTKEQAFYFPIEMELQLITSVKNGGFNAISQIMNSVYVRNSGIPEQQQNQFLEDLRYTLVKLIADIPELSEGERSAIQERMGENPDGFAQRFENLRTAIVGLASLIQSKRKSRNLDQIERMEAYLNENYADMNFSLKIFAQAFHMSESYLSQYFKEFYGENISTRLEEIRIDKACRMLAGTMENIEDISHAVGYPNSRTFRRAFKKSKGLSPTEYRERASVPAE